MIEVRSAWPPDGAQVILRRPHPWKGYTGTVTREGPAVLPGAIAVALHDIPGRQVGVTYRRDVRVLPNKPERRS